MLVPRYNWSACECLPNENRLIGTLCIFSGESHNAGCMKKPYHVDKKEYSQVPRAAGITGDPECISKGAVVQRSKMGILTRRTQYGVSPSNCA